MEKYKIMWLKELKIAIVEDDIDTIDILMDNIPVFKEVNEIDEARTLVNEALALLISLQKETKKSMQKIQKNINFLKVTQSVPTSKLNISS